MLSFFPTPYPDELLYSVFARYHLRSGNHYYKDTFKDLFGTRMSATVVLPYKIEHIIERLPLNTKITSNELIYNHTMYPFYSPFFF